MFRGVYSAFDNGGIFFNTFVYALLNISGFLTKSIGFVNMRNTWSQPSASAFSTGIGSETPAVEVVGAVYAYGFANAGYCARGL